MKFAGKEILKIAVGNWSVLLLFEIVYKIIGFSFVRPFTRYLLSILPGLSGVSYLSQENISIIFTKPSAVLIGLIILTLLGLYVLFEITAFMILCEKNWKKEKLSFLSLWKQVLYKAAGFLKPSQIGVFFMLPVFMFSFFSFISGYLKIIQIPEFILEYIWNNNGLRSLYIILICLFNLLFFLYLFGIPALLFSEKKFSASWRESLRLLRGKKIRVAAQFFVFMGVFMLVFFLIVICVSGVMGVYAKIFYMETEGRAFLYQRLSDWLSIAVILGDTLMPVFLCAAIIFFYHKYRGEVQPRNVSWHGKKKQLVLRAILAVGAVIALLLFSETEIGGNIFNSFYTRPSVIAHRAGAFFAPENTLPALSEAIQDKADGVEIDVRQLADETLIVMHDSNFLRTAGVDLDVWNTSYEAIKNLNAGYYYDASQEVPVPTLEEFLHEAGEKVKIMIELKGTGYEKNFEKNVLQMVETHQIQEQCSIASASLDTLRKIKMMDPQIETVYISAILIANQYDLDFLDGYSVETTSLSPEMVAQAHWQGKKIYGWTANSDATIKKILRCGADGIITDNPALAVFHVEHYGKNFFIDDIMALFFP